MLVYLTAGLTSLVFFLIPHLRHLLPLYQLAATTSQAYKCSPLWAVELNPWWLWHQDDYSIDFSLVWQHAGALSTKNSLHGMDYCIVYLSSSSGLLTDKDLAHILTQSQRNNRARGITGILLYLNGCIIQVLEGQQEDVKALYEVINRDPQHTQVTTLYSGSIKHRSFTDWSMGYKTLSISELNHVQDVLSFVGKPTTNSAPESNIIRSLVKVFYDNNHRN